MSLGFKLSLFNVAPGISIPLAMPYTQGSGTLILQSAVGLPTPPFRLTVVTAASQGTGLNEVLTCFNVTGVSGTTLTITYPTLENTVDQNFSIGDLSQIRDQSGAITDLNAAVMMAVPVVYTGLASSGTNQGTALPLLGSFSRQEIATTPAGSGVSLPTATPTAQVLVINAGTDPILVYPPSGGTIWNDTSPVEVNPGFSQLFFGSSATNYYT